MERIGKIDYEPILAEERASSSAFITKAKSKIEELLDGKDRVFGRIRGDVCMLQGRERLMGTEYEGADFQISLTGWKPNDPDIWPYSSGSEIFSFFPELVIWKTQYGKFPSKRRRYKTPLEPEVVDEVREAPCAEIERLCLELDEIRYLIY